MIKQIFNLILVFSVTTSFGQSLDRVDVNSAGGVSTNSSISIEYTLGESYAGDFTNSSANITFGFNQGYAEDNSSIDNISKYDNVSIYPNPGHSILNVNTSTSCSVRVLNMVGEMMLQDSKADKTHVIDVSSLATGMYMIEVTVNKTKTFFKWVKT